MFSLITHLHVLLITVVCKYAMIDIVADFSTQKMSLFSNN